MSALINIIHTNPGLFLLTKQLHIGLNQCQTEFFLSEAFFCQKR